MAATPKTPSYTREQWARAFLAAIGNHNPTPRIVNWVINWTVQEGNGEQAYNLLNTTQPYGGSYGGAQQGNIQIYKSFQDGVMANAIAIMNGLYPTTLKALQTNDIATLTNGNAAVQRELGTWGTGWKSWFGNNPSQAALSQTFSGSATVVQSVGGANVVTQAGSSPNTGGGSSPSGNSPVTNATLFSPINDIMSSIVSSDVFQRSSLVLVGVLLLLIGIIVLFVGHGAQV